jgi:hypothetical protein
MPTIFAIDGADLGYDDDGLGAYSSGVASLQTALISLGQRVGDSSLTALVLDGLIGPKTTTATNRAFAMYISSAPANFATGTLSQSQVSTNASSLASYVNAEVQKRGGAAKPTALVPAAAAPAVVPRTVTVPVSDTSAQIVKYAALGLGGVVVASVLYYIWRARQGRPLRGCDLGALPRNEADALERMMDRSGGVSNVFDTLDEIASAKADHVRENWQDERLARKWDGLARKMGKLATATKGFEVK